MSEFWIETKPEKPTDTSEIYQLTCTTNISLDLSGTATSHPVVHRSTVSDNYVRNPPKMSASGLLTNIVNISLKGISPRRSVAENIKALEALQASGIPFMIHFDKDLAPRDNCVFTSLNFTKSSGMGEAYKVNMSIQQILQSSQVSISTERFTQSAKVNDASGSKVDGGDSAVKKAPLTLLAEGISQFRSDSTDTQILINQLPTGG